MNLYSHLILSTSNHELKPFRNHQTACGKSIAQVYEIEDWDESAKAFNPEDFAYLFGCGDEMLCGKCKKYAAQIGIVSPPDRKTYRRLNKRNKKSPPDRKTFRTLLS